MARNLSGMCAFHVHNVSIDDAVVYVVYPTSGVTYNSPYAKLTRCRRVPGIINRLQPFGPNDWLNMSKEARVKCQNCKEDA